MPPVMPELLLGEPVKVIPKAPTASGSLGSRALVFCSGGQGGVGATGAAGADGAGGAAAGSFDEWVYQPGFPEAGLQVVPAAAAAAAAVVAVVGTAM